MKRFKKIQDRELIVYFKRALSREFISQTSKQFPNINIRTQDIFSGNCPILADWYSYDASKSYSIVQYLEGCSLVEEIFVHQLSKRVCEIQIVFALPNDEFKYYKDEESSFQKDIKFLITKRCAALKLEKILLQIKFLVIVQGVKQTENQRLKYRKNGKTTQKSHFSSSYKVFPSLSASKSGICILFEPLNLCTRQKFEVMKRTR